MRAVGAGDTSVGMTLLQQLGLAYSSVAKPNFNGIVITARRGTKSKDLNRVNLFAKVPNWDISACKSSREILKKCGYLRREESKLYCTVRARQPNAQGLFLQLDRAARLLLESRVTDGDAMQPVATWRLDQLERKLQDTHAESAWVTAVPIYRETEEWFHFRYVTFTSRPRTEEFANLIDQGTITVDHLISAVGNRVVEKGPLFKIKPENVNSLFPQTVTIDLLSI